MYARIQALIESHQSNRDPILLPFLEADADESRLRELQRLADHANPIIAGVVYLETSGNGAHGSDVEDIRALARLHILSRLERLKIDEGEPIANFDAYVAVVARNACMDHFRAAKSRRTLRLESADVPNSRNNTALLPAHVERIAIRQKLTQLWEEIERLPLGQRRALLLNLPEIDLFPILGIASIRQIALSLEMEPLELAEIWNDLPLDDNALAIRLGIIRQHVINLRKCARERLARRLKNW
jgi:DNA-directed RNA polymerase specialized sigma24 family protein